MEYQPVDTVDRKAEDLNLNCLLLAHLRKVAFFFFSRTKGQAALHACDQVFNEHGYVIGIWLMHMDIDGAHLVQPHDQVLPLLLADLLLLQQEVPQVPHHAPPLLHS